MTDPAAERPADLRPDTPLIQFLIVCLIIAVFHMVASAAIVNDLADIYPKGVQMQPLPRNIEAMIRANNLLLEPTFGHATVADPFPGGLPIARPFLLYATSLLYGFVIGAIALLLVRGARRIRKLWLEPTGA